MKSITQSILDTAYNSKLARMGYAIDYSNYLDSLYNPMTKETRGDISSKSSSDYYKEALSDGSLGGTVVNGFVDDESFQQAICIACIYYNFPVECESKEEKKIYNVVVDTNSNICVKNGFTTCSTIKGTIPDKFDSATAQHFKTTGRAKEFAIGVGLDLTGFGRRYFERFYSKEDWDLDNVIKNLKVLAEKNLLFAEITLDISGGKILTAPIFNSFDDPPALSTDPTKIISRVWLPSPLVLTKDYSPIGTIFINGPEGDKLQVNNGKANYPFKSSSYDGKNGIIKGLDTDYYDSLISNNSESVKNLSFNTITWNINGSEPDKKVRVRLYFDKEKRNEVEKYIGFVPASCEKVFGPLNEVVTTPLVDKSQSYTYDGMSEIYFEDGKYQNLNKDIYVKGLRLIWSYEVGNANGNPSKFEFVPGESWPSYGSFQAIERKSDENYAISKILDIYVETCIDSGKPYDENLVKEAREELAKYKRTGQKCNAEPFKTLGKDGRMLYAQTKHFWFDKLKTAMNLYQSLNFNSAFGLYYCMDCINNGWKKKTFFGNPEVKNAQNENERVIKAIDLREKYLRSLSAWSKYGIKPNGKKGGWGIKLDEWRDNTRGGNYNLTRKCKWNGNMV